MSHSTRRSLAVLHAVGETEVDAAGDALGLIDHEKPCMALEVMGRSRCTVCLQFELVGGGYHLHPLPLHPHQAQWKSASESELSPPSDVCILVEVLSNSEGNRWRERLAMPCGRQLQWLPTPSTAFYTHILTQMS